MKKTLSQLMLTMLFCMPICALDGQLTGRASLNISDFSGGRFSNWILSSGNIKGCIIFDSS